MKITFQDILFAEDLNKDVLIINSQIEKEKGSIEIHKINLHFLPDPAENTKIFEKSFSELKEFLEIHRKLTCKKSNRPKIHLVY